MAAAREPLSKGPEIVDLRRVNGRQLEPLLLEETTEWQRELDWDFRRSAELVRQYADSGGLSGVALLSRGEVAGYGYCVLEDHKGLVGDLYLRPPWRTPENEARLLTLLMEALEGTRQVRRIESQLMLFGTEAAHMLERSHDVRLYHRVLMALDATKPMPNGVNRAAGLPPRFRIEPWADYQHQHASAIIAEAYRGHVDSEINDQYRTQSGAQRFLYNIVQYPGCGSFYREASQVAYDRTTRAPVGVVLTSVVGRDTGHVTQLCIAPSAQGHGVGRALLERAVSGLRACGLKRVSLTVTLANRMAHQLYERCGFREVRRFPACVWER